MSIVDLDSWFTEYNGCEKLCSELQSLLVQRGRENSNSKEYLRLSGLAHVRLRQLGRESQQLQIKLQQSGQQNKITKDEAQRRHRQLEVLQSSLTKLNSKFNAETDGNRAQLFARNQSSRLWEAAADSDDDPPLDLEETTTVPDFRRQQTQMLEDQDRGLDNLAQVISRQKNLAIQIGEEVETQNEIIDDLAVTMERTDGRIGNATTHILAVSDADSTCWYYVVMSALFAAIIIVAFI